MCQTETYRWARCKEAAPLPRLRRMGLPLPEALLDVLEPALAWEDLQARCAACGVVAIGFGHKMLTEGNQGAGLVSFTRACWAGFVGMHCML